MPNHQEPIAVFGAGNMGSALVSGMIRGRKAEPEQIRIVDPRAKDLPLFKTFPGLQHAETHAEALEDAALVLLAVKPQVMPQLLSMLAPIPSEACFLSIAVGLPIAELRRHLDRPEHPPRQIVRAMPNTPALIGQGITALSKDLHTDDAAMDLAESMLSAVGEVVRLPESAMNAAAAVSGSGPAYVFLMIEALADGGVRQGLSREVAMKLAAQTLIGAAAMVNSSGLHPGQLKDQVCSPGGTTIEAIAALEAGGLRATLIDAVTRATEKAEALAQPKPGGRETGGR